MTDDQDPFALPPLPFWFRLLVVIVFIWLALELNTPSRSEICGDLDQEECRQMLIDDFEFHDSSRAP